jgi:hypothetical protein
MNMNRIRRSRKVFSLAAIAVITLAFTTIPAGKSASAAEAAEQVIFSGVGNTSDGQLKLDSGSGACRKVTHLFTQVLAEDRSVFPATNRRVQLPV